MPRVDPNWYQDALDSKMVQPAKNRNKTGQKAVWANLVLVRDRLNLNQSWSKTGTGYCRLNQLGVWTDHDRLIYQDNLKYESYLIRYTSITKYFGCRSPFLLPHLLLWLWVISNRISPLIWNMFEAHLMLEQSLSLPAL